MQADFVLLPGDGIGPEIVFQAKRVLTTVAAAFGHEFRMTEHLMGGCAIDACGNPLPDETLEACRRSHAVLVQMPPHAGPAGFTVLRWPLDLTVWLPGP